MDGGWLEEPYSREPQNPIRGKASPQISDSAFSRSVENVSRIFRHFLSRYLMWLDFRDTRIGWLPTASRRIVRRAVHSLRAAACTPFWKSKRSARTRQDRKSTRLNSSHEWIS